MTFKDNMEESSKSYIKDVLTDIDNINNGIVNIPLCE